MTKKSFGRFAKEARIQAQYGLRDAARRMNISATYLSRVESGIDQASAELTLKMAGLYGKSREEFNAAADRPSVSAEVRGRALQMSEDLRALYRMGDSLTSDEVEEMIRFILNKRGLGEDEIERALAQLRSELPRIRDGQGDGMFAADIKPRYLTKNRISAMAYDLLASAGLNDETYAPPTPIELLVDKQEGVSYEVSPLPTSRNGDPVVLGLTRWGGPSERKIVINSALADGKSKTQRNRFNFTLAHELFHALEHLPLIPRSGTFLPRFQLTSPAFVERARPITRKTSAQKAVERWSKSDRHKALFSNEDWREWQANCFASALLVPEWSVIEAFNRRFGKEFITCSNAKNVREEAFELAGSDIEDRSLADEFNVSSQAMAVRLLDLQLVREV